MVGMTVLMSDMTLCLRVLDGFMGNDGRKGVLRMIDFDSRY